MPTIQWFRNGNAAGRNSDDIVYADLVLDRVDKTDGGPYSCVVSNEGGTDEMKIHLDVLGKYLLFFRGSAFCSGTSLSLILLIFLWECNFSVVKSSLCPF